MACQVRKAWFGAAVTLACIVAAACARPFGEQSHGGAVTDHVSFVDNLRAAGYTVEIAGEARQPFLKPENGTLLRLSGSGLAAPIDVQSFDYPNESAARSDAERINPDGNPKNTQVSWVGPPHFFRKQRVIVLYVGSDPAALELLNRILGAQFAGATASR